MVAEVHSEAYGSRSVVGPVGIAVPGTLDHDRRTVLRSVNLPLLDGRAIGQELALRIEPSQGTPALFTDAETATWGEFASRRLPPSRGLQPARPTVRDTQTHTPDVFVHLRLGSGVACGLVIDGVLQRLDAGRTTHLDVLVIDDRPDAPMCCCGRRGCLETIASGMALQERATGLGCTDELPGLQRLWEAGEDAAMGVVRQVAEALAVAISNLRDVFRANVICIGGGVTEHLPAVWQELTNRRPSVVVPDDPSQSAADGWHGSRLRDHALLRSNQHAHACVGMPPDLSRSKTSGASQRAEPIVEPARLGDNAGVVGAALLHRATLPASRQGGFPPT